MSPPPIYALLGGTSGTWDTCNSPSTQSLTCLNIDSFQSVAIIFRTDYFKKNYHVLYLSIGEAKTKYNIINESERNQNSSSFISVYFPTNTSGEFCPNMSLNS